MTDVGHTTKRVRELSARRWKPILSLALALSLVIQTWLIVVNFTDAALASTWVSYAANVVSTIETLALLWGAFGLVLVLISSARLVDDFYANRLEDASGNPILYRKLWQSKTRELDNRRLVLFAEINKLLPALVIVTNAAFLASMMLHQFSDIFLRFYLQQLPSSVFAIILLAGYEIERRRSMVVAPSSSLGIGSEPNGDTMPAEQSALQSPYSCN